MEVLAGLFYRRNHRRIQNDSPYSDVTSSPFKLPTESPTDLKMANPYGDVSIFPSGHHQRKIRR